MRVLWIVPGDPASKANMIFAKRAVPALEARGLVIRTFHVTSRSDPFVLARLWKEAKQVVAEFDPQLVHGQYGSIAGLFACALGRPAAVTFRGSDVNGDPDLAWYRRPISWTASQLTAFAAVRTIYVAEALKRRLVYPGKTGAALPSPLDLEAFGPLSKEACRRRLGLPRVAKLVAFVSVSGRSMKRPELARAVCARLSREGREARLLEIQGVDPSEIPVWLGASDCLLFTSRREGSPNAVREALACGVPVVSVRVGDVGRWIAMDPGSRLSEDDSAESLARAVEEVWDLPEPRVRRVDFSELTLDAHARSLASIYKSVAAPQSGA